MKIKLNRYNVFLTFRRVVGIALILGIGMSVSYVVGTFFIKLLFSMIVVAERLMDALFRAIVFYVM